MVTPLVTSLPLILVIMTAGVDGQQYWAVNYGPSYVCALKGSTVKMFCVLNHPHDHQLTTAFWTKSAVTDGEISNLCLDPEKSGRVQCVSEYKDTYSITLTSVTEADKHIYYCRFTTDRGTWIGIPGARLDVTDLQVETEQSVKEGDSVRLMCKSSCSLPQQTTFIWYRNTQRLTTGVITVNQLQLQSVSRYDAGNYQCAVSGYQHLPSPAVYLNVEYPPQSVSVSISASGKIMEGDSVTLICSSDPNPPAEISWYKGGKSVGSGRIYNITKISSDHSGEYKCKSRNKYGEKDADAVMLNVMYGPRNVVVTLNSSGEIVEGDSVTLSCSSDSNPPALNFSWFKGETFLKSGDTYSITNITSEASGNVYCFARNEHGSNGSAAVTVNVMYPPKSISVSISPSGEIVEGDSVTLSCSSDSNPPALNFSWFKENQSSAVGSGQSFSISSFNSSHSGRYYCEAQNKHGSQRSASVSVSVKGVQRAALHTVTGIVVGCGGLIIIIISVFIKKKRRDGGAEVVRQNQQDDRVGRSTETAPTNDVPVYSLVSANQRDDLYANIKVKKPKRSGKEQTEKESGGAEEIQYASVHHFKNKDMNKTEETTEMQHLSDANRSEDVIYSSVK
ncbi:B-cell receptor CD22-like [Sinocyclocheilus anshuiensis]|uniref:B-cell receptor CD22-like n=1 Tax=Sinocyclocheilus anshuiensis TaxID=1608454 RepID=UPI0007B8BB26|nr:PREDICTED: B-cell receptor CD22-like [Sinocyclocheilus anshuiensis]